MKKQILGLAAAALTVPAVAFGQSGTETPPPPPTESPSPNEIVASAPASEWVAIEAEDLLVMTLAPDRDGNERKVVIQLMPAPFSQGWVENIRKLARAEWYDGISVNRVQDNYVVQWGDPGHDNPEGEGIETKALPEGLRVMTNEDYTLPFDAGMFTHIWNANGRERSVRELTPRPPPGKNWNGFDDPYARAFSFVGSFPVAATTSFKKTTQRGQNTFTGESIEIVKDIRSPDEVWPVHCYGMVGVGRNYSPDTGSGAELYTVIGHAPRHLDRNIALAGQIISGLEHLSSLTRGTGVLGFYTEEEAGLRTPILSIRVASDLAEAERPRFEYLDTRTRTFVEYARARSNRRDPFFIVPAGGADVCNIPVPIRAETSDSGE
jgi:cyclophilin family peptidyl-prolyl cis-trans isomerase